MKKNLFIICFTWVGLCFSQQTHDVDFLDLRATLTIVPDSSLVKGNASYFFKILKPVDSVFIDAKAISVSKSLTDLANDGLVLFKRWE